MNVTVVKHRHALSRAEYIVENENCVRVVDGDKWGRFDMYGAWIDGEIRQCDPHLCIWLAGKYTVQERNRQAALSKEKKS